MTAQLRRSVDRLAQAGLDTATFAQRACAAIRRVVPHRAACVVTLDPDSHLLTGTYKFGALAGRHELDHEWARLEYDADDPTAMSVLVDQAVPAVAVSHLSGGIASSPRASQLLAPSGYTDELRLVALSGGQPWGGVSLFRGVEDAPFDADEVACVAELTEQVATGLRLGLVHPEIADSKPMTADGPAVLLVDETGRRRHTSPAATELLDALTSDPHRSPADAFIHGLAVSARRRAAAADPTVPQVRLRLHDGRWFVARAGVLHPTDRGTDLDGEVVVTVEAAPSSAVVPLMLAAFGLTPREHDVTESVLRGSDTRRIARGLGMSPYTVQDHLTSVFAKIGVRSRHELMARIFNASHRRPQAAAP